jgi:DNA-binding NarL/FixJ family response regulator
MSELQHYGTKRHSGRYPWGSGGHGEQRIPSLLGRIEELKKQGLSETDIAKGFGMKSTELRQLESLAKSQEKARLVNQACRLKDKGYSITAIGERMGRNESTVRGWLQPSTLEKTNIYNSIADTLADRVNEVDYLDIGLGTEAHMGISRDALLKSVRLMKAHGYKTHYLKVDQLGTEHQTEMLVLTKADKNWADVNNNRESIRLINKYSENEGRSFLNVEPVNSVKSDRIAVRYAEDGGSEKDGVIELRRGVPDISLGNAKYAQVRIGVDDSHFLKGMAVYSDDLPKGVDIMFNTNKSKDTPLIGEDKSVLKPMKRDLEGKVDKDNPFGATIKTNEELILAQRHYINDKGEKVVSPINIVNEEGDWRKWSVTLSSQVLSKQTPTLAKQQLEKLYDSKIREYEELVNLSNPVVKKKLLDSFADDIDSASAHLKAAGMPGQASHVIIPFPGMKETEVYAPNYRDGDKVVLIRFPHGGRFEIPELTVNNRHKLANETIKQAPDAIGINHKVAERLSGADFDGDTVLVIPNSSGAIKSKSPLKELVNFDPKVTYAAVPGMTPIKETYMQTQMGEVSNLITDMTIRGASDSEIARAVKHSMVIIDSYKHNLNYKLSYEENQIQELRKKYQDSARGGASTLISKSKSEIRVPLRKTHTDPETGKKVHEYVEDGSYVDKKTGKTVQKTQKSKPMYETDDAHTLSSGTPMEKVYADHANRLKMLANQARKESIATQPTPYSSEAKRIYSKEVSELESMLDLVIRNKPKERQAALLANSIFQAKVEANPDMDKSDRKKLKGQALAAARYRVGAKKPDIPISKRQWEAIQAGAITKSVLSSLISNTDTTTLKKLATPRAEHIIPKAKLDRVQRMFNSGRTYAEIADTLGISVSTVNNVLNG